MKGLLFILLFIPFAFSLYGTVYDISLDKVPFSIVSVYDMNGTIVTRTLADSNANYSILLPNGTYRIIVYKPGLDMISNETITVFSGTQRYDIILVPILSYENISGMDLPGIGELPNNPESLMITKTREQNQFKYANLVVGFFAALLLFGLYKVFKIMKKGRVKEEDQMKILDLITGNGGKMYQKELVKKTGWSEAKVSLVLKELKKKGKIKKRKIGREKIVYIPEQFSPDRPLK